MVQNISALVPVLSSSFSPHDMAKVTAANSSGGVLPQQISPATQHDVSADGQSEKDVNNADITKAVSYLNDYIQNFRRDLKFSVDEDSGRVVVKVIDSETNEVIRQIPSEEALTLSRRLEQASGFLLRAQA